MMFLPEKTPAPPFALNAAVSGRPVSLQTLRSALLLIFHSYQTATAAGNITRAIRDVYPSPDQVLVANVADMRPVPRLLRGTANAMIKKAYLEAAGEVPPGQEPADHIIILPDWDGALYKAYRSPATQRQVALVLVDSARQIAGSYFGEEPLPAALRLLDGVAVRH